MIVDNRGGKVVYFTECVGDEDALIDSNGQLILSNQFGVWKFGVDGLDQLFSSSFEQPESN